ncbi:hypothetical protein J3Q64DRAFT_1818526 [Phycomyces blakesleeanus]|uniref:Uncharacterized protein n=2 Tax=Phycomyces blakesleeanus TaxID=4837 RepID=A0A163B7Y9_PHYB8|nr:hypothetical protein PHYBLDRAFT_77041 [Phycomyces blakesleeanus NRRL 1555(-)]OAD78741.1 hypothetical protein PHYBLDRAFT_77041 [Phycomyces blakesleeanus NRRL 1555(-)]|eukprot:XP_018296781.1 hypothetical protein PHYBLDRAFT_77041 [Phycomyces blakesleeanus NRRL 1555(-)]
MNSPPVGCLFVTPDVSAAHQPGAQDILRDQDVLEIFRLIKQILRHDADPERLARLLFCVFYALGDSVQFSKPAHENMVLFRAYTGRSLLVHAVQLPKYSSCCPSETPTWEFSRDLFPENSWTVTTTTRIRDLRAVCTSPVETCMEPQERGFYYQDGRIQREPTLLQRYAEQGLLTQASITRKRRKPSIASFDSLQLSVVRKKTKIPHRHGEFEQRRDTIVLRLQTVSLLELEEKAVSLPSDISLAVDTVPFNDLGPALQVLVDHANQKPHLDNGMNQYGIYYNIDYYKLYVAFEQFQQVFAALYPDQVVASRLPNPDRIPNDRERSANMKAYRPWIEPLLSEESNWAAFRRNIIVGERMVQLARLVGQGVLLMTKEISGSKLHLTFTNKEWASFLDEMQSGKWGTPETAGADWLLSVQQKLATRYWFSPIGNPITPTERKALFGL